MLYSFLLKQNVLMIIIYGSQNNKSITHITVFFNLLFILHNLMRAPAKKYILIVRHMGAINLVLSKIVIEMTNNNAA